MNKSKSAKVAEKVSAQVAEAEGASSSMYMAFRVAKPEGERWVRAAGSHRGALSAFLRMGAARECVAVEQEKAARAAAAQEREIQAVKASDRVWRKQVAQERKAAVKRRSRAK